MSKEEKVKKPKSKASKIVGWIITCFFAALFVAFAIFQVDGMIHKNDNFGETIRFGFGSFVVQTDSMEPDYAVNSAIITYKEDPDSIYKRFMEIEAKKASDPTCDDHIDMTFKDRYDAHVEPYDKSSYTQQTQATNMVMTHRLREIHVNPNVKKGEGRYIYIVSGINISEHQSQKGQYQAFNEKFILGVVQGNSKVLGGFFQFVSSPWGLLVLLLIPAGYLAIASVVDIFKVYKEPNEPELATTSNSGNTNNSLDRLNSIQGEEREKLKQQLLQEMMKEKMAEKASDTNKEPSKEEVKAEEKPIEKESESKKDESKDLSRLNSIQGEERERLKQQLLKQMMEEEKKDK